MSHPNTIQIDNVEYVRNDKAGAPSPVQIVVADRGWVFVGNTESDATGAVTITNAKVIRYWGTDEKRPGLGYIALNGPTEKTKLDPSGVVRVPAASVVAVFDANAEKWS